MYDDADMNFDHDHPLLFQPGKSKEQNGLSYYIQLQVFLS